jgi:hypothetical protein
MFLLLNQNQCPQCGKIGSIRWDQHRCAECNAKLFHPSDDFVRLKQDWVLSFWVYFHPNSSGFFRGWAHSGQLNDPKPHEEFPKNEKPPESYGRTGMRTKLDHSARHTPSELGAEKFKTVQP